jgi:hypothetical protein
MFFLKNKAKSNYKKLFVLIIFLFSLSLNHLAVASELPVSDFEVRENTNIIKENTSAIKTTAGDISDNTQTIITNTSEIASILAGNLPGAQYDNIQARETLVEVKLLLRKMTDSIATFAKSGFDGNPAFITNTGTHFQNVEDQTINNFLVVDTSLNSVCSPFRTAVKQNLGDNYTSFNKKIACTITNPAGLNSDDFIQSGGWATFVEKNTKPQNNIMGASYLAQMELDSRIAQSRKNAELEATWGAGFKSWKDCSDIANADYGRGYDGCTIKTPASVILNKVNSADTSSMRELEMADNFNTLTYVASQSVASYSSLGSISYSGRGGLLSASFSLVNASSRNNIYDRYRDYLYNLNPSYYENNPNNNPSNPNNNPDNPNTPDPVVNMGTALTMINYKIDTETNYLAAQKNILKLLDTTEQVFASSTCSTIITDGIISQITGSATGTKDLIWNKLDVTSTIHAISNNLTNLNSAKTSLNVSGLTDAQIVQIYQNAVTRGHLNTEADVVSFTVGGKYIAIKAWIQDKVTTHKTSCALNTSLFFTWGIE